jgi:hypothetical protein
MVTTKEKTCLAKFPVELLSEQRKSWGSQRVRGWYKIFYWIEWVRMSFSGKLNQRSLMHRLLEMMDKGPEACKGAEGTQCSHNTVWLMDGFAKNQVNVSVSVMFFSCHMNPKYSIQIFLLINAINALFVGKQGLSWTRCVNKHPKALISHRISDSEFRVGLFYPCWRVIVFQLYATAPLEGWLLNTWEVFKAVVRTWATWNWPWEWDLHLRYKQQNTANQGFFFQIACTLLNWTFTLATQLHFPIMATSFSDASCLCLSCLGYQIWLCVLGNRLRLMQEARLKHQLSPLCALSVLWTYLDCDISPLHESYAYLFMVLLNCQ